MLLLTTMVACSAPPAEPRRPATAAAAQASKTEAVQHADALLEDLKRREDAQANFNREHPPSAPVPIRSLPASDSPPPAASVTVPPQATATPAAPQAPTNPQAVDPARDETWWRQQRQSLQRVLDDELAKLAEAEKLNLKNGYDGAQALYKQRVEAVAAARLAIDKLHDDARRAGVPPAWLR